MKSTGEKIKSRWQKDVNELRAELEEMDEELRISKEETDSERNAKKSLEDKLKDCELEVIKLKEESERKECSFEERVS